MQAARAAGGDARFQKVSSGFAQELLTGDVAELLQTLTLGQASVVGFSMGGGTGLCLATEHPDLVRTLIVAG